MNMQAMLAQAQRMQRELRKAKEAFYQKEFTLSKGGAVTVVMMGNKEIKSVSIEKDAFEEDNKEMIEDLLAAVVNELIKQIDEEEAAIEEAITGQSGGFPF